MIYLHYLNNYRLHARTIIDITIPTKNIPHPIANDPHNGDVTHHQDQSIT
jgi:hypothetical protein